MNSNLGILKTLENIGSIIVLGADKKEVRIKRFQCQT